MENDTEKVAARVRVTLEAMNAALGDAANAGLYVDLSVCADFALGEVPERKYLRADIFKRV